MTEEWPDKIAPKHREMWEKSGITAAQAIARGIFSINADNRHWLADLNFVRDIQKADGLLIPLLQVDGEIGGWQFRPDNPRVGKKGREIKYETPLGQRNMLDFPPGVADRLANTDMPVIITEGVKKGDAGALAGLAVVDLPGTWNWIHNKGGLPDFRSIAFKGRRTIMCYDSDLVSKEGVWKAATDLAEFLAVSRSASIEYILLPQWDDDAKTGLDDYLVGGGTVEELWGLCTSERPGEPEKKREETPPVTTKVMSLPEGHKVFRKWLGLGYDADALNASLAAAAVGRMTGDPLWLLVIGGSGNAKTETVQAVGFGAGAVMTSTLSSEAALLSGTPDKDRASDATGGLLRLVGEQGLLVIKDFTSIISANSRLRGDILSALREIYDGHWYRDIGGEGGRRLWWKGRLALIGACTTAWDRAHDVITTMGDRFVILRTDSSDLAARKEASHQSIDNTRAEVQMRAELAEAAGAVLNGMRDQIPPLSKREIDVITKAADLVTRARTAVEYDYSGKVVDSHALEMPTRFSRQLAQIVFGGQAIGLSRREAIKLAIRCARDSVPPMRLLIIRDLEKNPDSPAGEVRKRLDKPWATVDRQLQALHLLGVCTMQEKEERNPKSHKNQTRAYYTLTDHVDPAALTSPEKLLQGASGAKRSKGGQESSTQASTQTSDTEAPGPGSNKSGEVRPLFEVGTCEVCGEPMTVIESGQLTHPGCASPEEERLRTARAQLSDWLDSFSFRFKEATIDDIDAAERLRDERKNRS